MPNVKRNQYKLNRQRGFGWEDELTRYIKDKHYLGDAFNLGGSTNSIPDILVFSNFVYIKSLQFHQQILGEEVAREKFYKDQSITAIECKYTTHDHFKIPKEDIDKGFEFLNRLGKYDRFVVIAVKFKTTKKQPTKFFYVMKWNYSFIRADYTYMYINLKGEYQFMKSNGVGKSPSPENTINTNYFRTSNIKLVRDQFNIEEI
jgi:hypothetical protein